MQKVKVTKSCQKVSKQRDDFKISIVLTSDRR